MSRFGLSPGTGQSRVRAAREETPPRVESRGRLDEDPGDDRLSRLRTIMGPAGLTAVFGMGTGVAPPVWSPGSGPRGLCAPADRGSARRRVSRGAAGNPEGEWAPCSATARPLGWGSRLVCGVFFGRPDGGPHGVCGAGSGWSSRSAVRTGRLRRSPAVHSRPIDLVVSQEPSQEYSCRKPGLGGGFALRCLQRLSGPDLATRRCPERDSRHTSGRSSPILSY